MAEEETEGQAGIWGSVSQWGVMLLHKHGKTFGSSPRQCSSGFSESVVKQGS